MISTEQVSEQPMIECVILMRVIKSRLMMIRVNMT